MKALPCGPHVLLALVLAIAACGSKDRDDPAAAACVDQCGNSSCEEMVCMAVGCPCAETAESCPKDCPAKPN